VTREISSDGTRKYLVRIAGGHEVEVVYIPETDRGTLCISSQVGCTLTCSFCHTGTQKLVRNLTAGEIIGQVMLARDDLNEWPEAGQSHSDMGPRLLSNIVLMGMGEPLYNFENVRDAMKIAMDPEGIQLSRRRITLSTSGVVPEIARTADEIGCQLAVSFHATTDDVRDKLVPINKRWNIQELIAALAAYPKVSNSERITFEYVMLKGVNDTDEDAHRLMKLIEGIPAKINLIPFNEWPGAPYERSTPERIKALWRLAVSLNLQPSAPVNHANKSKQTQGSSPSIFRRWRRSCLRLSSGCLRDEILQSVLHRPTSMVTDHVVHQFT